MRITVVVLFAMAADTAASDWRQDVYALAAAGQVAEAVALAERGRAPWLAPHLARRLPGPRAYVGWVATDHAYLAYGLSPEPWITIIGERAEIDARIAALKESPGADASDLRVRLLGPVAPRLGAGPWLFATDGALDVLPFALLTPVPVVHVLSERAAALSAFRTAAARARPPSVFAFAPPGAPPAVHAGIALATAAIAGDTTLLTGADAAERLRVAAYDGALGSARFVLITSPAGHRDGAIMLELDDGDSFALTDATHLRLSAELVVLSACDAAVGRAVAESGAQAGTASVLVSAWRIDEAAAAQFVAAVFEELARGATAPVAVARAREAFAARAHGDAYADPRYWGGWQLWGG